MNHQTLLPIQGPSPPRLLLAQFCSASLPASSLDPQLLSLHDLTITVPLRETIKSSQRRPHGSPAPEPDHFRNKLAGRGYRHGGLNE